MDYDKLQQDPEFQKEHARIEDYTKTVCSKLGWDLHDDKEITDVVKLGLAKNRKEHGFQACPCYGPLSYYKPDGNKNMKVNCPCEPARLLDIPGEVTFSSLEEMNKKTEGWPDRGEVVQNPDGTVTLKSYHPGFCHCFLFTKKS